MPYPLIPDCMKLLMNRRWKIRKKNNGTAMTIKVAAMSIVQSAVPSDVCAKMPNPNVKVRALFVSVITSGQKNSFQ